MGATKFEFRIRVVIMWAIVTLGFWAPWIDPWGQWPGMGRRIPMLEWLALELSRLGVASFTVASTVVILTATLVAALSVVLRVWGTAYLGPFTVSHQEMQAGAVLADGPYRYLRNPLYLGSWCLFTAMAFLMPVSGALFATALLTVFLLRLILGEEAFLLGQLGEPYREYLRDVPRLLPHLRSKLKPAGRKPHWLPAAMAELFPISVFLILACLSWRYDNRLMIRAIIVCFGVSVVVRALMPGTPQEAEKAG
jgi:protein-S-isoprenylcysteine O-methyltransferase Ste14